MIRRLASVLHPGSYFGPIFYKEMLVSGRRAFSHWARFGTGMLLAFVLSMTMLSVNNQSMWSGGDTSVSRLWSQGQIAPMLAMAVGWVMCIVLPIVAAAYGSGTIVDEKSARTMDSILATPMSAWTIIASKVTSRLVQTLLIALIALPILLAARTYGGIELYTLMAVACVTACQAIFATCVASWFSLHVGKAWAAMAGGVFVVAMVNALPWLIALLGMIRGAPMQGFADNAIAFALHTGPFGAIGYVIAQEPQFPGGGPQLFPGSVWIGACVTCLLLSLVVIALSARSLRMMTVGKTRQRVKQSEDGTKARRRRLFTRGSRTVIGHPVAWRELRQPLIKGSLLFRIIGGVLLFGLLLAFYVSVDRDEQGLHATIAVLTFLIATLLAVPATCGAIAGERETRTLDVLLCSPVSAFAILFGKFLGGFARPLLVAQVLTLHVLLYTAIGLLFGERYFTLWILPHIMLITIGVIALLSSTGIFFGVVLRRTLGAMLANIGLWVIIWMGVPLFFAVITSMSGSDGIMDALFMANPMMMVVGSIQGGIADWGGDISYDYDGPSNWGLSLIGWTTVTVLWCLVACGISLAVLFLSSRIFAHRTLRRF